MFGLRRRLPAGLRPGLSKDERIIAWAAVRDGADPAAVVVTTLGVWLPGRGDRLGWHQIHKASWSGTQLSVIPAEERPTAAVAADEAASDEAASDEAASDEAASGEAASDEAASDAGAGEEGAEEVPGEVRPARADVGYTVMADGPPITVTLADPGDVPEEVRKRVTRSVAHSTHHAVSGGGVRVVARRVPGRDGVVWHVRYDEGTDPADPGVIAATADLVADAAEPFPSP